MRSVYCAGIALLCIMCVVTASAVAQTKGAIGRASNVGSEAWILTGDWTSASPMQTTGSIKMRVLDVTMGDSSESKDTAHVTAEFNYPADGPRYTVKFTCITPRGENATHHGGVAIMRYVMGPENLVGVSLPRIFAYIGAFGKATIVKSGETIATNQSAYAVLTMGLHDDSQQFMTMPDPTRQEMHLFVPGSLQSGQKAVTGFPNGAFYAYWPGAAFEVLNVGGTVSGMEGITVPATMITPPAGTGPARATMPSSKMIGTIDFSLTETAIHKKMGEARAGLYDVKVTNNSSRRMGVVYRGTDLCCTEYIRFSTMMKPGESQTFRWYFAPGKVSIRTFVAARKTGSSYTDVTHGKGSSSIVFR